MKYFEDDLHYTAAFLYLFLIALNISIVWVLPCFPTQDGPNHIYNLAILHDLLNGGNIWGSYYSDNLRPVPNLGFLVISYPFVHFLDLFTVERIFISIYILLMSISVPVFIRTLAPSNLPLSFIVFPLIFNFCLMMGFYSFELAVPCFLLATSFAWATRHRSAYFKVVTLNIIGITLFYFHLIPFVLFILSLFIMLAVSSKNVSTILKNTSLLTLIICPLIIIFLEYIYSIRAVSHFSPSKEISFPYLVELILELLTFSSYSLSPWQIFPSAILLIALYPLAKSRFIIFKKNPKLKQEQLFSMLFSTSLIFLYLLMPFAFGGGSYFNQRLAIIIVIILLPLFKLPDDGFYRKYCHLFFFGIAMISLLINAVILRSEANTIQEFLSGLTTDIPRGSIIALYKPMASESKPVDPLQHASAYYALEKKGVDAGNYAAHMPYFQIQFKDSLPHLPDWNQLENAPEKIDWKKYPGVQYLLGWKIGEKDNQRLRNYFKSIFGTQNFCILKRI